MPPDWVAATGTSCLPGRYPRSLSKPPPADTMALETTRTTVGRRTHAQLPVGPALGRHGHSRGRLRADADDRAGLLRLPRRRVGRPAHASGLRAPEPHDPGARDRRRRPCPDAAWGGHPAALARV